MAGPFREAPVLKGENAFNFEMRRLEVEHVCQAIARITYRQHAMSRIPLTYTRDAATCPTPTGRTAEAAVHSGRGGATFTPPRP